MVLVGMNSWIQSSRGTGAPERASREPRPVRRTGLLRAGIATALVALTLLVGFSRPAETAAYKEESLVCTTIQAGFDYAFGRALKARAEGDTAGFNTWNTLAHGANDLWFAAGCGGDGASGTFTIQ